MIQIVLSSEQANNLMVFLNRVNLSGQEAEALVGLKQVLIQGVRDASQKQEATAVHGGRTSEEESRQENQDKNE